VIAEVTEFVRSQTLALPPRLVRLLRAGLWGFRVATVLAHARPFGRLPLAVRRRWVAAWAYGSLTPARQLFRAPRSLALLAYYESDPVRAHRAARGIGAGPR